MDATRVALLREVLASTGWVERTQAFARELTSSTRDPGGLLLLGTPDDEPWHLAAHLDDESRWNDLPALSPTLVRWSPPQAAPPHLRIGIERIEAARRGETVLVVAEETPPSPLLERVADARRYGATVFSLHSGDQELRGIAHEALTVPPEDEIVSFDAAQHLVSEAAGHPPRRGVSGFRARLSQLLDTLTGTTVPD